MNHPELDPGVNFDLECRVYRLADPGPSQEIQSYDQVALA